MAGRTPSPAESGECWDPDRPGDGSVKGDRMRDMSTLLVNGPPGSGKCTVAQLLANESPRGVHLLGDTFWHFIANHLPPGLPGAEQQNRTVIAALASAAVAYDRGGYAVYV